MASNSPRHYHGGHGGHRESRTTPRRRPDDLESSPRPPVFASPTAHNNSASRPRASGYNSYAHQYDLQSPSSGPGRPSNDSRAPMMSSHARDGSDGIHRKKSLIRPERRRNDSDDPNYHYRKHAQRMAVHPSTTGHDPVMEDHDPDMPHSSGNRLQRTSTSQNSDLCRGY